MLDIQIRISEADLGKQDSRVVMRLPAALAPVKMAIMPLVKKEGLPEKAQEIMDLLKYDFNCQYDEKDSIGKRYRRQDAIGTPFCITIGHKTLKDKLLRSNTATPWHKNVLLSTSCMVY